MSESSEILPREELTETPVQESPETKAPDFAEVLANAIETSDKKVKQLTGNLRKVQENLKILERNVFQRRGARKTHKVEQRELAKMKMYADQISKYLRSEVTRLKTFRRIKSYYGVEKKSAQPGED